MRSKNKRFLHRFVGYLRTLCLLVNLLAVTSGAKVRLLPRNIKPVHYNLEIITNLADDPKNMFTFEGKVDILVQCLEPTKTIVLNALEITIERDIFVTEHDHNNERQINVTYWHLETNSETLTVKLGNSLRAGYLYNIGLKFIGNINDKFLGYYRSSYIDNRTKQKRWLAATHFEATHARRAFPCFDEPKFKATFQISIGRHAKYTSLSNEPLDKTEPMNNRNGWFWDRFKKTLNMSTYLVAYIVFDFKFTIATPIRKSGYRFRVWSREDAINQTEYARELGPKLMEFFEGFLRIKFPLAKQDMIAVPNTRFDAMENWGLITYRENLLLMDSKMSSLAKKQDVAKIVSNEIAHQWFGDLVTMKWWSDLWLNEGFSTYMASVAVHHLYPEWNSFNEMIVINMQQVFFFDALQDSHPLSVPSVRTSNEINAIFDTITYKKGAVILFMMVNFLRERASKRGIINYMLRHRFGSVVQDDLFKSLTTEAHKVGVLEKRLDVKTIMDTWTLQTGYPVIKVQRNYKNGTATIAQRRYYRNPDTKRSSECWWIPLSYTNQSEKDFANTRPKAWLPCPKCVKIIDNIANPNEWVIFNIRLAGVYRVNYDDKNWEMLISTLNSDSYRIIPIINRVQLIEDSANLAAVKRLKYKYFFDILRYLKREIQYLPWKAAAERIQYLHVMLRHTSVYGSFQKFVRSILEAVIEKSKSRSFDPSNMNTLKFANLITLLSCKYDVGNCRGEMSDFMKNYITNPDIMYENRQINGIPSNELDQIILCYGVQEGNEKEFNFLWEKYKMSNEEIEKQVILKSLGCTKDVVLLQRYLEWTLEEDSGIRRHERLTVFTAVAQNDIGHQLAKTFFENHIKEIYGGVRPNINVLSTYLLVIAEQITTVSELQWFKQLIVQHHEIFSELLTGVQRALEFATINTRWRTLFLKNIGKYLQNF